jgi:hypothetical protein
MKRLIVFVIIAAAAWYGWKHYDGLRGTPANEVVIVNTSGRTLGRVRLSIGDTEYPAYDSLFDGKSVVQKFPLATRDGQFHLHWVLQGKMDEPEWSGGMVTSGPVRMRHRLQIMPGDGVVWSSAPIPADSK